MTRRSHLVWKLLLAFFATGMVGSLVAWGYLLTTLCGKPRIPAAATGNVIPYNCHGTTVFITDFDNAALHWLIPLELVCIFLGLVTAAMVVLGAVKVKIDVQVHVRRTDGGADGQARDH
ncbi:MAG TPA: hypothetical protein VN667_02045 [Burkholderiales bacterium]|nr:hypothetical protein [Burkholderiales bacterium]